MYLGSASTAIDLADRALAAGLPLEPHRGENWVTLAIAALTRRGRSRRGPAGRGRDDRPGPRAGRRTDRCDASPGFARASALRRGDLAAAQADAQAAIELAPDLLGAEFLVLAVAGGGARGPRPRRDARLLRRLIDGTGVHYDTEFMPSTQLRYASGVLRAAAGNHEAAIEELRGCGLDHPTFGGENPAALPWRSAAALSLAELGRHDEAGTLAADEVRRARRSAPRGRSASPCGPTRSSAPPGGTVEAAGGGARRAGTLAGAPGARPRAGRPRRHTPRRRPADSGPRAPARGARARRPLRRASPGAPRASRARGNRRPPPHHRAHRRGLPDAQRAPRGRARRGEAARTGEIAQTLFVTEKTVETHLGRAFRKLDISSRRQLPDVLAGAAG